MLIKLKTVELNNRGGENRIIDRNTSLIINSDRIITVTPFTNLQLMVINLEGADEYIYTTMEEFESKVDYKK